MVTKFIYILLFIFSPIFNLQAQISDIYFKNAFQEIENMLTTNSLNFREAVFLSENAFFEDKLDENEFNNLIWYYVAISDKIMTSGDIIYTEPDKEKALAQCAVFMFMTMPIPMTTNEGVVAHTPFSYNYDDFAGQKDWTNMFVSTLMETKKGNCHSLPYLYKMIMDELGQESYLALAPNHIYIKVNNKKVGWYNIELTCADFPTDAWLMASGYIHLDAIRNGLYMDALTEQQSVALTLVDLAQGYQAKYGLQDGKFILQCCDTALKYFPNYINALLLKTETLTELYKQSLEPELMQQMSELVTKIHELGYRKMPNEMYLNWLGSLKTDNTEQRMKSVIIQR